MDPADLAAQLKTRRERERPPAQSSSVAPRHLVDHPAVAETAALREAGARVGLSDETFFQPQRRRNGGKATTGDGEPALLNFSSFDYLGLCEHPTVHEAATAATKSYGTSVSAARIVGGEIDVFGTLERRLAEFVSEEAALTFVSGYLTNISFLGWALRPEDLVIQDELVHNSMVTGARLSGARRLTFKHNDVEHLAELLGRHRASAATCLVLVEGVYSMDGDIGRIDEIADVTGSHEADLFVDEAHAFGVLGATGRGSKEHFGLDRRSDIIWMSSLSKAFAGLGGFVATDQALLDAARFNAPGAGLFCTAMTPAAAATSLAALEHLQANPGIVDELRAKADRFANALRDQGVNIGLAQGTPVVPVLTGGSAGAIRLSNRLREAGIIAHAIMYPAVPEEKARVRFFISRAHSDDDLQRAAAEVVAAYHQEVVGA